MGATGGPCGSSLLIVGSDFSGRNTRISSRLVERVSLIADVRGFHRKAEAFLRQSGNVIALLDQLAGHVEGDVPAGLPEGNGLAKGGLPNPHDAPQGACEG